jgi:hypothetical protein
MFDLRITTLPEASDLLRQGWPTRAVSLVCPGTPGFACHGPHHLLLHLHDIAEELDGHVVPCRQHLLDVLDFTADLAPGSRLLVHCVAGVSRSTAAAIGILIARGLPWRAAQPVVLVDEPEDARVGHQTGPDRLNGLPGGALVAHLRAWSAEREERERRISAQAGSAAVEAHGMAFGDRPSGDTLS